MDLDEALAQADVYAEETEVCKIDNDLRTITVPSGLQTVGVESDEDVRRLNFQMPKQYGEVDLSEFNIRINFMNANNSGDVYAVTDKAISGDNITFSWLVGRNALAYRGSIRFIVCLKKTDAEGVVQQEFNTTVATLSVLEGLETTEQVIQENPDIIEQILARLDELEENGGGGGTPGKDGVGISNIAKTGTAGLVDTYTITLTNNATYTFTVTNGKDGDDGDPGQDGITPTIGENGNWYLGETDTGNPSRGNNGITPNIQIGTVQTLEPGQQATASMTGTTENPLLNLGIPKGGKGDPGEGSEAEPYELPIMSDTQLGGGKAVEKTDEDVPVAVDPSTGQLFVPTYPENTGGDVVNVDAELKEYMNVAKPAIASAIINKGGNVEPDDSLNDYATRILAIPNDVYPAETLPVQTNLSASGLQDSVGIKLNWSDVNASGYLILRKENAMPATSADGDIVYNGTYAADGYTDTGVQKGKVYYYRIFPRNSKNQYQSLEDGAVAMVDYKDRTGQTLLGDLPLGSKIKFGQYLGADYFWEIVDTQDKASGFVTVAADQNLGSRQFDAPEPNSPISSRRTQGNNRWAYSAARQLLNSDQDTGAWWTVQYEYDAEPSYAAQIPGFLKDFTAYEKGIVVTKTNKCILPNDDGGGTEIVEDKFWFPSYYAMGLGVIQPLEDNHIYEKFVDNASRSYQSHYWLRSINGAESPSYVRYVNSSGTASNSTASISGFAMRPFCQLPTSAYMTWSDSDEAYVFADDSQRNPSAT
ncbi:DUF6273 domain-containing protein [Anaerostipes butyraticus]|uniref:DUF6273 domain-containing protein n=1 Tax=Anaerostipes butyraticus TaxID=645466 RepID=A0A916VE29_9FIRM|nr:DUF6273 domain-containing protein [Anaerostipes butyraticus]GFO86455.1 hypothetical protein ANBU17_28020 [Anaerostipes butyraticus]